MERHFPIKHAWVDSSLAPLYQVVFPTSASDEQLLSYCRAVERWSAHVTYPVAWLMDLSRVEQVSAQQRAIFAKYIERMEAFDQRCNKGSALILRSALVRGAATAIFWLYTPRFPHRTFAEPRAGLAWLREVLSAAGVDELPGASGLAGAHTDESANSRMTSTRPTSSTDSAARFERPSGAPAGDANGAPPSGRGSLPWNQS